MKSSAAGRACAKINLGLRILSRREDGFHEICSIFHTVSLCDEIRIELGDVPGRVTLACDDPSIPAGPGNLAFRAAERFLEASGLDMSVHIELSKRIPVAGGLGGGSSDAACVLRLLSRMTEADPGLDVLASGLGSDVPFLLGGGAAVVTGRGEAVRPIQPGSFWAVLLNPGIPVSTPEAYASWDEKHPSLTRSAPYRDDRPPELAWHEGRPFPVSLCNDFLPLLLERHPAVSEIARRLERVCPAWGLSGSGPTFYGLFRTAAEAEAFCISVPRSFAPVVCRSSDATGASSNW
jgi:4-diphosphocytidyl-2-C-methyl-D-erythritol kinase